VLLAMVEKLILSTPPLFFTFAFAPELYPPYFTSEYHRVIAEPELA
jgi:hypothetical protein